MTRRTDGSISISGAMPADEFGELIGIELPSRPNFSTVGGLVMEKMGRIPMVGETIELAGWMIEVVDLDGRRVDKVLGSRLRPTHRARGAGPV